ncbi:putative holin-like toxin [Leuconostoc citreum]|nr:putative holin-like toxin [Leuconostoc citreum]MDV8930990.1 putative holin-like toxin [Leuconostoc citreum]
MSLSDTLQTSLTFGILIISLLTFVVLLIEKIRRKKITVELWRVTVISNN